LWDKLKTMAKATPSTVINYNTIIGDFETRKGEYAGQECIDVSYRNGRSFTISFSAWRVGGGPNFIVNAVNINDGDEIGGTDVYYAHRAIEVAKMQILTLAYKDHGIKSI